MWELSFVITQLRERNSFYRFISLLFPVSVQKFTGYFIKTEFLYYLWEGSLGWSVNNIVMRAALRRKFVFSIGRASKLKEIRKTSSF